MLDPARVAFDTCPMKRETLTGGCQCGRIRYAIEVENFDAYLCHCRTCQRASGGIAIAFVGMPADNLTWTAGLPDYYQSSPFARRGFCAACGTPLSFEYLDKADADITVGSLDDPSPFKPIAHFGVESRLEHWRDIDGLPAVRSDSNQRLTERWMKTVGNVPN